jgi:hypothetical protein
MDISITVEGVTYIIDRQKLLTFLNSNGKTYTNTNQFNEYTKIDENGRTILNG